MHVQLSLSLHLYLAFNQLRWKWPVTTCCPRYRRLVALKRAGCVVCWLWRETVSVRTCSKWCHFAFMFSRNRFLHWPTALSMTFCYILAHVNEAALQVAGHRGWYRRQVFVQCTHVPASVHKFFSQPDCLADTDLLKELDCFTSIEWRQNASFPSQLFKSK